MNDEKQNPLWKRMSFKGNKVWVQIDTRGHYVIEKGTVLIKYNLNQNYEYRVKPENLNPEDQAIPAKSKSNSHDAKQTVSSKKQVPKTQTRFQEDLPENCIKIYTDGASSGNPGPAGIGVLFIYNEKKKEVSKFIGRATNNIAELTAIKVALEELKRFDLPVRIFSDSGYAIGLLTQNWKPRKNQDLVIKIKNLMGKFSDLSFIKVKGHAGIKENEVADYLATSAIKKSLD